MLYKDKRGQGLTIVLIVYAASRIFYSIAGAKSVDAQRISVVAYASNERAICFYEKLAFRPKSLTLEAETLRQ